MGFTEVAYEPVEPSWSAGRLGARRLKSPRGGARRVSGAARRLPELEPATPLLALEP